MHCICCHLYNIVYINHNYLESLSDFYKYFFIKYPSFFGSLVDNSTDFWIGSSCIFYKKYSDFFSAYFVEIPATTYVYKCSDFSFISSNYYSLYNMCCTNMNIYSCTTSYGLNRIYLSKYMVKNAYIRNILVVSDFYVNSYREYVFYKCSFRRYVRKLSHLFRYPLGIFDEYIYSVDCLSSIRKRKYYFHSKSIYNYNVVYPGQYLFDYNIINNNKLSFVHYNRY